MMCYIMCMLESKIQCEIVQYLQLMKVFFFSVPNEAGGKDAVIRMSQLKSMGLRSGVADLVVLLPKGKTIFLEVKNEKGKQSNMQKKFEEKVNSLGFEYYIVRSVEDVQKIIKQMEAQNE